MELNYTKIGDLIKDNKGTHFNCDLSIWSRTRHEDMEVPIKGTITGEIPKWINGTFIQNGPGAFEFDNHILNHVFDGMAMLHRYRIENGTASYQCKFIKSQAYESIRNKNEQRFSEFGTPSMGSEGILKKLYAAIFSEKDLTDNTLVSVYPIGEDMYAFTETPIINRFNPENLNTMNRVDLSEKVNIVMQLSHPHIYDGVLYNCGTSITQQGMFYNIFRIPNGSDNFENIEVVAKIRATKKFSPCYMHSFGITENFFIIIEQPLLMPAFPMKIASILKTSYLDVLKWEPNENTLIHLVDRRTGDMKFTFNAEAFLFLHIINQYEKNGHVVLDLICYKDSEVVKGLMIDHLKKLQNDKIKTGMFNSRALRFVMPLEPIRDETKNLVTLPGSNAKAFLKADGSIFCIPELLCDEPVEFGTIWYKKHIGRPYRYFYGIGADIYCEYPGKLMKVDLKSKTIKVWQEANAYPSEPIFIPAQNGNSEDNGVIISSILHGDPESHKVTLLFLAGKNFKELARCEFKSPSGPITKVFHGWFIDDSGK